MAIIASDTLNKRHKLFSPNKRTIYFERRQASLFNKKTIFQIFNLDTNSVLYDSSKPTLGGTFNVPKDKGDATLVLDLDDTAQLGKSTSSLRIWLQLSNSLVSNSAIESSATLAARDQAQKLQKIEQVNEQAVGTYGFKIITSSTPVLGNFSSVMSLDDSTVLSSTCSTSSGDDDLSSYTLVRGTVIPAPWTAVAVDSGAVIAYYSSEQ